MKLNTRDKILLKKLLNVFWVVLGIFLIFLIWYVVAISLDNVLVPTPIKVLSLFFSYYATSSLYVSIGYTLARLLLSFLVSFVLAFILGIIASEFNIIKLILKPFIVVLKTISTAAVILILVVLLKPYMALFIIIFLVMFPILYEAVINGYESIDEYVIKTLKLDTSTHNLKAIIKIKIPYLIPYLILATFQTFGLGMKVAIMGEVLVGTNSIYGLGILIRVSYNFAYVDQIIAYSIHAIIIIGLVDIIIHYLKRYFKNKYSI